MFITFHIGKRRTLNFFLPDFGDLLEVILPVFAEHGEGFSRACLAIRKYGQIIAVSDLPDAGLYMGKQILLGFVR